MTAVWLSVPRWGAVLVMCLFSLRPLLAIEASPQLRTTINASGDVWVGQKLTLVVELLAPGYFSGSPTFDLPPMPSILVLPPAGRPVLGTEEIDGISYTVQRYEVAMFAQHAGAYDVPAFPVRFTFRPAALGAPVSAQRLLTQPVHFKAILPPGAEGLRTILSARALTAEETWQPQPGEAKAGDAFTRTITFSAPDIPAMAFPPFPAVRVEGLGIYPNDPEVRDLTERGALRGQRRESITYVCERPGRFVIPATRLTWWNLDDHRLRTIDFPERTLDVAPNPAFLAPSPQTHALGSAWRSRAVVAVAICASFASLMLLWRPWHRVRCWRPVRLAPLNPTGSADRLHRR